MIMVEYFLHSKPNSRRMSISYVASFVLAVLVWLSCLSACEVHAATPNVEKEVTLDLSTSEKKWLAEHPEITMGTDKRWEPFVIAHDDGSMSGIEVDLIKRINEIAGLNIRIVLGDWPKIVAQAKARELDGLLVSTKQEERAPYFLFTDSRLRLYRLIFSNRFKVVSLDDLKGKRVGYQRGTLTSENFLKKHSEIIAVPLDGPGNLVARLKNNEIDAILGGSPIMFYLQERMFAEGFSPYMVPGHGENIVYSIRKDWPELQSIMNKALAHISHSEIANIKKKYIDEPLEKNTVVQLSVKEKAWLAEKHRVKVRVLDIPPLILSQKDVTPSGIAIDYLRLLTKRTGIQFDYQPSTKSFGEAIDGIKNHQGPDLIPVIIESSARQRAILFTEKYISSPIMIFIRSAEKILITKIDDLRGKKIAILKGSIQHNMVKKDYPELDLLLFDNDIEAMQAVANDQADAYIGTLLLGGYNILHRGLYNLQLAAPTPFGDYPISMGVRNDWPELVSIINKGLASITEQEHTAIHNRYVSVKYDTPTTQYLKWVFVILGLATGIIGLFFLWNRSLAKQVSSSTAELLESELRFRRVLESTSAVPWERDVRNEKYTYIGKQVEQLLGYPTESWIDKNVWVDRIHPEDQENVVHICENGEEKKSDFDLTYRAIHMDGSYRWIRDVVSVTKGQDGPIKLVGFMYDITEQKELAIEREELDKHWEQAQKLEAVGTLAGGIAHDFNNILSAILGFAQLAKDGVEVGSEIEDDLNEVLHAGHRAKELVQQILAFSRQAQIDPVPMEPQLIVKEALKMLRSSLPATIEIKENISSNCGLISAVPAQIHQILVNLCTNAFHAMENEGGTMFVEMKLADNIPPDLKKNALGYLELLVSDTGQGIEPPIIDKIFDPFFTTKEPDKGTGMGLSIIYGIVRDYGGRVTVESEKGQGTTFRVYLPLCEERLSLTDDNNTDIPGGNERILFIDDEDIIVKMGKTMLEKLGYEVTVQTDSLEALKLFQLQPDAFDLIITDQTMPEMTGLDIAKRILLIRPDMPIILCTGFSSIVNEEVAQSIGIKAFTHKPISKSTISNIIRKVLDEA